MAVFILLLINAPTVFAAVTQKLSNVQKNILKKNWQTIQHKVKGPYSLNYCVCTDGTREPVLAKDGSIANRCKSTVFCGAFRAPVGEALTTTGMYVGNSFASDLFEWDKFPNHHNLVQGYILENYYMTAHPESKLAEMQTYRGLKGAEYEARDMPLFQEKYLADPSYNDYRHFILSYELERRFFTRNDQGNIQKIRSKAAMIQQHDKDFKPMRDAVHGRIATSLFPMLRDYRDKLPQSGIGEKIQIDELIALVEQLTSLDESILIPQINGLSSISLRASLKKIVSFRKDRPARNISNLAKLMVKDRHAVANRQVSISDARRLIAINVTAVAVIQSLGSKYMDRGGPDTISGYLQLLQDLADATYGTGLISGRERKAITNDLRAMLVRETWTRDEFITDLRQIQRVLEWSHAGAQFAFGEVWPSWTYLIPDIKKITDDIVRSSPMLLFGQVFSRLENSVSGEGKLSHQIFDREFKRGVRALNAGLAFGELTVTDAGQAYDRNNIVVLADTPVDLQPAAGIITRGEGNAVSHVQLLARSMGIPNVLVSAEPYEILKKYNHDKVLFVATPGGRVYLKRADEMSVEDRTMLKEYNRSRKRRNDGKVTGQKARLHIDPSQLNLRDWQPISLDNLRRSDSGIKTGPKAAYLGELKQFFPDNVARGLTVPFAAYHKYYKRAVVMIPKDLRGKNIARQNQLLREFVEETYASFFGEMIPAGLDEQSLSDWIKPRLAVIRYSIEHNTLSPELKEAIYNGLNDLGLLNPNDRSRTVGCFVRSDTNVEDQPDFNGAGLNLTIFNLNAVDDIYEGLKRVWASPFSYRSFSWRQTLIDEPLWVLPSVIILESIFSEASGVLITADINSGNSNKMLIATSEGVGGAVDGTPTETLLWSPEGVELITSFKSPWRRLLLTGGGSEIVPSSGSEYVLNPDEIKSIVRAGQKINRNFEPVMDRSGKARPWDVEYGFVDGKLWLFQARPFIGNKEFSNVPALVGLDAKVEKNNGKSNIQMSLLL